MRKMTLSLVAAGLLASVAPVAQAALITFGTAGYTAPNTLNGAGSGAWSVNNAGIGGTFDANKYTISATGGINNSQSVVTADITTQKDGTGVYQTAFNPVNGPITVSGYLRAVDQSNKNTATTLLGLGILASATDSFNNLTGVNYTQARLIRTTTSSLTYLLQIQNNTLGTNAANINWDGSAFSGGTASTITLTSGNWYFMSSTYTKSGNNLVVNLQLLNALSDGSLGSTVFNQSGTVTNATLANDTSVYGGFRASANAGMANLDNVTVVPEPTSLSLLGLGAAGLLLRRRKSV